MEKLLNDRVQIQDSAIIYRKVWNMFIISDKFKNILGSHLYLLTFRAYSDVLLRFSLAPKIVSIAYME